MKIISLIALLMPALLPLENASHGVFFLIGLWYIATFLLVSLALQEHKKW
jgi:hypothetical protein